MSLRVATSYLCAGILPKLGTFAPKAANVSIPLEYQSTTHAKRVMKSADLEMMRKRSSVDRMFWPTMLRCMRLRGFTGLSEILQNSVQNLCRHAEPFHSVT